MEGSKLKETVERCSRKVKNAFANVKDSLKTLGTKVIKIDANTSNKYKLSKKIVNKKRFAISCSIIGLIIFASVYALFASSAYTIKVNGTDIGKVRSKKNVETAIQALKQQYKDTNKTEISFTSEVSFEKTRASSKDILKDDALVEALSKNLKYTVQACSIYVNSNVVATLKTRAEAYSVLKEVQNKNFANEDLSKVKEISFAEKVELKDEFVEASKIMDGNEVLTFITKGTNEVKTHKIESGESFWTIAKKYNMTVADLTKANPGVNPEKVKIGQVINLIVPKPLISVKTVETITFKEKAAFEQSVEFSNSMYKDETRVKVKGEYGEKEVTANVTKINGIETARTVLREKIIKPPKTQILVKGTKDPPPKKGTGTFSYPARGSISSRFGYRWGRSHTGVDIAAPYGSAVRASDGGVVTWVGYEGGYGRLIKIDHGANLVTYYGHLSKYYVKVGQKVYKGQKIGAVGSSGNSTGPHVHFEIRKNGVPTNPLSRLK